MLGAMKDRVPGDPDCDSHLRTWGRNPTQAATTPADLEADIDELSLKLCPWALRRVPRVEEGRHWRRLVAPMVGHRIRVLILPWANNIAHLLVEVEIGSMQYMDCNPLA